MFIRGHLWGDGVLDEMMQEVSVLMGQYILHHAQHVDGRVGEVLKPVLAPVAYNTYI